MSFEFNKNIRYNLPNSNFFVFVCSVISLMNALCNKITEAVK